VAPFDFLDEVIYLIGLGELPSHLVVDLLLFHCEVLFWLDHRGQVLKVFPLEVEQLTAQSLDFFRRNHVFELLFYFIREVQIQISKQVSVKVKIEGADGREERQ